MKPPNRQTGRTPHLSEKRVAWGATPPRRRLRGIDNKLSMFGGKRLRTVAVLVLLTVVTGACSNSSGTPGGTGGSGGTDAGGEQARLPPCPVDALKSANGPVEVVVWHFLQAKTKDALDQIAARYNASQSKVKVRVENQGQSNDELWKSYRSGIKAKSLPAIAILDDTVTQQIIDSGTVLPAQSCINAERYDMSDFLPSAKAFYTQRGTLYPGSLNLSGALLYFNKNHFRRAGLDADSTPKTLDEMAEWARKIKAAGVVDKPIVLQVSPPLIEMLLTGIRVPFVNNDNGRGPGETTEATFDQAQTVELYRWVRRMIDEGLLDALPQSPGQVGHYLAMASQKSSMTIETSTAATSVEAFLKGDLKTDGLPSNIDPSSVDTSKLDIGAAPVPGIREPGRLAMGGGAWYMTNTTSPEVQAAAWDFIKFFNQADNQATWNIVGSYLPYRMSAVEQPDLRAMWTDTLSGRWLAVAYKELLDGIDPSFPGPMLGPYERMRDEVRKSIDELIFNNGEPAAVVSKAADGTTKAIQEYNDENF